VDATPITPTVVQREIDRFAHLLVQGQVMPLLMLGLDVPTQTITVITGPILLTRMREDEFVQETVITKLRDALGHQVAGPVGR
jgi:hypothetical protein